MTGDGSSSCDGRMSEPAVAREALSPAPLPPGFSAGEIAGAAFRIFFGQRFVPFAAATLLVFAPALLLDALAFGSPAAEGLERLSTILWNLLGSVAIAAITRGTLDALAGEPHRIGAMLGAAAGRGLRVFGVGLIAGLLRVGGLALLAVPGLVAIAGLYVAEATAVAEASGARACLGRSWSLTQGHRWGTLALSLLFQLLPITSWLVTAGAVVALADHPLARPVLVLGSAVSALAIALQATAAAVAYHRLRVHKEGVAPPALAAVFE